MPQWVAAIGTNAPYDVYAGFFLFLFLLLYVMQAPPTPLALRKEDANRMWDAMASRLRSTSSALLHHAHSKQNDVCEVPVKNFTAWMKSALLNVLPNIAFC